MRRILGDRLRVIGACRLFFLRLEYEIVASSRIRASNRDTPKSCRRQRPAPQLNRDEWVAGLHGARSTVREQAASRLPERLPSTCSSFLPTRR